MVAQVCHRLDGIPLAIELAAARVKVLSIEQINARLNDRFRLLTGGSRTAVARQRTLKATVDWSYDLLSDSERRLLRRLSVFAGGWTIEAAEDVSSGDGIEREEVLDLLSRLVDKSLVNVDNDIDESRRYRFLETVRQYGRERLLQSGEAERLRDRHLAFFHELVRRAEPELTRAGQVSWLNRLHREHDNLRSALESCLAAGTWRPELGTCGGAVLLLDEARLLPRGTTVAGARAVGQQQRGIRRCGPRRSWVSAAMTFFQGDFVRTRVFLEESATLGRTAGDLSVVSVFPGDDPRWLRWSSATSQRAHDSPPKGRQLRRASGTPWIQGPSLAVSCVSWPMTRGTSTAPASCTRRRWSWFASRERSGVWGSRCSTSGCFEPFSTAMRRPERLCAEGLVLYQEFGDRRGIACCLGILAGAEARGRPRSPRGAAAGRHGGSARERGLACPSHLQRMDRRSLHSPP